MGETMSDRIHLKIRDVWVIFLLISAPSFSSAEIMSELWISSTLNETQMKANATGQLVAHSSDSAMHCLGIAQSLNWSVASCFSAAREGSQCQIWSAEAIKAVAGRQNGTVGATPCKIRKSYTSKDP
jgi:hypothetical protein